MWLVRVILLSCLIVIMPCAYAKDDIMKTAKGEFEVKLAPVSAKDDAMMRLSIDKTFSGDLKGSSIGQMMAGGTEDTASRVYVAIETVTATLDSKKGSFILVHRGTMSRDEQVLSVIIAPDSGLDGLYGIRGTMDIDADGDKHSYTLNYVLPDLESD